MFQLDFSESVTVLCVESAVKSDRLVGIVGLSVKSLYEPEKFYLLFHALFSVSVTVLCVVSLDKSDNEDGISGLFVKSS